MSVSRRNFFLAPVPRAFALASPPVMGRAQGQRHRSSSLDPRPVGRVSTSTRAPWPMPKRAGDRGHQRRRRPAGAARWKLEECIGRPSTIQFLHPNMPPRPPRVDRAHTVPRAASPSAQPRGDSARRLARFKTAVFYNVQYEGGLRLHNKFLHPARRPPRTVGEGVP